MKKIIGLALVLLGLYANVALGADIEAGKAKAVTCTACHGANGISPTDLYPNLAGQKAGYLVKQMKAFKDGTRKEPTMNAMVAVLSDQDMEDLAAFYASMK
ncbi:c-type cytochrome [Vibrio penaeicida]|uniref:Cytochrome c n=1 Tax=Vibrio penaeicida TaxID=104609 RepID=A0AAV5NJS8_9VIBR|nr:cytochrome c [Vibrio penaeicida]RTZ21231.1 cytochrome c [Vibrio penaeicida]GLQ70668.1 cytochrome c [Vibrio penaeicida]